jgi:hypothetical protein
MTFETDSNRPALARGSQVGHDDPWNSEHIDRLPPEVRTVGKTSPEKGGSILVPNHEQIVSAVSSPRGECHGQ